MRPNLLAMILALGVLANPPGAGEIPEFAREVPAVPTGPPSFAFNGRDLDGFYTWTRWHHREDPDRVFTVADGMVRVSGEEAGGFATVREFSDYHLVAEWRWGTRTYLPRRFNARNSGIMVHCHGADGQALGIWMASVECQIIEGGTGDLILVPAKGEAPPKLATEIRDGPDGQAYYRKGGRAVTRAGGRLNWWGRDPEWGDVLWFRGRRDVEAPVGEWNRMEVICDGDKITCVLNGVVVNAGTGSSLTAGKILFQSEGAEIFFRKIEVRPLRK